MSPATKKTAAAKPHSDTGAVLREAARPGGCFCAAQSVLLGNDYTGVRTATIGSAVYDGLPGPGGRVRRAFAAEHYVRFWHKADISRLSPNVCFWG